MDSRDKTRWERFEPFIGLLILAAVAFSIYQVYDYTECSTEFYREVVKVEKAVQDSLQAEQKANLEFVLAVTRTEEKAKEAQALRNWLAALNRVSEVRDANPYPTYRCDNLA